MEGWYIVLITSETHITETYKTISAILPWTWKGDHYRGSFQRIIGMTTKLQGKRRKVEGEGGRKGAVQGRREGRRSNRSFNCWKSAGKYTDT